MAQCSRSVVVAWLVAALVPALAADRVAGQAIETVKVTATPAAERVITLPGELLPFQATAVTARVAGFVEQVHVDRGALVRQGQVLATLATPELVAQTAEALTRVQQAEARKAEADARLVAAGWCIPARSSGRRPVRSSGWKRRRACGSWCRCRK